MLSPQQWPWPQIKWTWHRGEWVFLMLVKACQCSPTKCGTILLMQLSSTFFYHENALRNVSLACGHQAGKNLLCYRTWNVSWLYVLQQNPKVHMNFSTGEYGWGFIMDSLGFWDRKLWFNVLSKVLVISLHFFWAALSFLFFWSDRKPLVHKPLWIGWTLRDRLEVESSWSPLINKPPALLIGSSHDWFNLGGNDSFILHWSCVCDKSHNSFYEYRYIRVSQHVHLILIST